VVQPLLTRLIAQESTTHNYAGKLTWRLAPDHVLSVSLVGTRRDEEFMRSANMDVMTGMSHDVTDRQDLIAHWQSALFDRRWRIDASLGMHRENYSRHSPYGDIESQNDVVWYNSPSLGQFNPALGPYCQRNEATGFDPCPVQGYQSGGYGIMREVSAIREAGQIKFTNVFSAWGAHELKYGVDFEYNRYDDKRWNSGMDGARGQVNVFSTGNGPETAPSVVTLFQPPYGTTLSPDADYGPYYQDSIRAKTKALNSGLFLQESYMPISNLTVNLGLRWEMQRLYDYNGGKAFSIADSIAPRLGAVYDPTKEGRSKIFVHYGRYYESIPMDLANRAFGGEGVLGTDYNPDCAAQNWRNCPAAATYPISGGSRLLV
jgi:hypothetical protein